MNQIAPIEQNRLKLSPLSDGIRWQVSEDYLVEIDNFVILVERGFITNLVSTPRILWKFIPRTGKYTEASVVHDYLYFTERFSRKESDRVFLKLMERNKVFYLQRRIMYLGARIFGWIFWNRKR